MQRYSFKNLKSQYDEFQIDVLRDRNGEFEPKLIPKYQRDISGIEEKVISLYARGMAIAWRPVMPMTATET